MRTPVVTAAAGALALALGLTACGSGSGSGGADGDKLIVGARPAKPLSPPSKA